MTHHHHHRFAPSAALWAACLVLAFPLAARAQEASSTPPADASVATGDASASATSENDVDENALDASAPAAAEADNAATTTSDTEAAAQTGGNTASSSAGSASVATGDAYASANSVNIVNANIVDSSGLLVFSDLFSSLGIDLRGLDLSYFDQGGASCSGACGDLSADAQDQATTTSFVSAVADTGGNTASSSAGSASVATGDAYASANSVNVVNSNLVRSNYLLLAINDFGDLSGDIVLPGAAFFERLLANAQEGAGAVEAENAAVVEDSTSAAADTGGNTASSSAGGAAVATGQALASATSINTVNTNLTGGSSIYLLFRIWGAWDGQVQGLPPGMSWYQTPEGVTIVNDGGAAGLPAAPLAASSTNDAALSSQASAYALTGGNEAAAGAGDAAVATGDAYASANSVNIVNTNIIGANWILAIFNIFGDFSGDISFGQPDLWLGAAAQTGNPTIPGSTVTLRFTVSNLGDADATGVRLSASSLAHMLHFAGGDDDTGDVAWDLGTIPAGATEEFSYTAQVGDVPEGNSIAVPVQATLTEDQSDANDADNTDSLTFVVMEPGPGSQEGPSFSSDPKLLIHKVANPASAAAPAQVSYDTQIYNDGGTAYAARARETLTGPDGAVVRQKEWALDTLAYQDGVDLSYTVEYATDTPPGAYTDVVEVDSVKHFPAGISGSVAAAPVYATTTVEILPQAPAAPAALSCGPYLAGFIAPGAANDPAEVEKLQQFLIEEEGERGLFANGDYDGATIAAVKRFQAKYAADILAPWGYTAPTGYVYYTTAAEINDLACGGAHRFELTASEEAEIAATRALLAQSAPPPVLGASVASTSDEAPVEVGYAPPAPAPASHAPGSWWGRLLSAQQSMLANVLSALTSASAQAAGR
jgi:hypothetical protein